MQADLLLGPGNAGKMSGAKSRSVGNLDGSKEKSFQKIISRLTENKNNNDPKIKEIRETLKNIMSDAAAQAEMVEQLAQAKGAREHSLDDLNEDAEAMLAQLLIQLQKNQVDSLNELKGLDSLLQRVQELLDQKIKQLTSGETSVAQYLALKDILAKIQSNESGQGPLMDPSKNLEKIALDDKQTQDATTSLQSTKNPTSDNSTAVAGQGKAGNSFDLAEVLAQHSDIDKDSLDDQEAVPTGEKVSDRIDAKEALLKNLKPDQAKQNTSGSENTKIVDIADGKDSKDLKNTFGNQHQASNFRFELDHGGERNKGGDEKVDAVSFDLKDAASEMHLDGGADSATKIVSAKNVASLSDPKGAERFQQLRQTDIIQQIVEKAKFSGNKEHNEMIIKLKPDVLGNVRLNISTENNHVTIKIMADSSAVKEALENNLHHLKSSFLHHGLEIGSFDVQVSDSSQDSYKGQTFSGFQQRGRRQMADQKKFTWNDSDEESTSGSLPSYRIESDKDRIDYYV